MKNILRTIRKYVVLAILFIKTQLMAELEYKINFFSGIAVECGYFLVKISYIFVVIKTNLTLDDLGPYHIVTCIGVYVVLTGVYMLFWNGFSTFPNKVQSGMLDLLLVKPISTFFMIAASKPSISMFLPNFIFGWGIVIWGFNKSGEPLIIQNLLLAMVFMLIGVILIICIFGLPAVISLWVVRVDKLNGVIGSFWDFNNVPMSNYPKVIQKFGLYIIPIFAISNPAGYTLLNRGNMNLWGAAIFAPIVFGYILSSVWRNGLKKYHSASS